MMTKFCSVKNNKINKNVKKNIFGKYKVRKKHDPFKFAAGMENLGAGEILVNSIDNDGMMRGYDLSLVRKMTESVSIPVIACGGAGSKQTVRRKLIKSP